MSMIYEQSFTVDSRAVDLTGCARPSAVLGYLQEAATIAALELKASGPEVMEKYHCIWMIARMWLRLDEPLRWNETFTVRTWHRGAQGASTYRDFDLLQDGRLTGEAVSTWVLADAENYKLLNMGQMREFQGTDGGELCKSYRLHGIKMPKAMTGREQRPMRYSDTDINAHVNNSKYADFACDALHLERELAGKYISEFRIGYLGQCRAGETITVETATENGTYYARGLGAEGDPRFRCALRLEERRQ